MNNTLIFLRHAETIKEKERPVSKWDITKVGREQAQSIADSGIFDNVDVIISSSETKAIETLKPIANKINKQIQTITELGEVNRDKGGLLSKEEYDETKRKAFADFTYSNHNWESMQHALDRFSKAIEQIDKQHENKKILIGSHGTVMTLYFSKVSGELDNIFKRWKNLKFLQHAIITNGEITKDIC